MTFYGSTMKPREAFGSGGLLGAVLKPLRGVGRADGRHGAAAGAEEVKQPRLANGEVGTTSCNTLLILSVVLSL